MNQHADTSAQPAPVPGRRSVTDAVIADMQLRREHGRKKYGTELESHNGRDALADAYQEVLDFAMYLKQTLMERDAALHEQHEPNCQKVRAGPFADCDCDPRLCRFCGNPLAKHPMRWTGTSGRNYTCDGAISVEEAESLALDSSD